MALIEQAEQSPTRHTLPKRAALQALIERVLAPEPDVQAVLAVGSVATGRARADSDIDAVVWLDPFDPHIAPAEFIWRPADGSFRSIFSARPRRPTTPGSTCTGRPGRLARAWARLADGCWPAEHGLVGSRTPAVAAWLAERIAYPVAGRRRVDEALVWLDQLLDEAARARLADSGAAGRPRSAVGRLRLAGGGAVCLSGALAAVAQPRAGASAGAPWLPAGAPAWLEAVLTPPGAKRPMPRGWRRCGRSMARCAPACRRRRLWRRPRGQAFVRTTTSRAARGNMDAWQRAHDARGQAPSPAR